MEFLKRPTLSLLASCLLAFTLLSTSGCRSYRLGHPEELPFETIFVQPASNESYAPQARAILSANLREAVIRDSRVRLVADPKNADAILEVSLVDYKRRSGTRNPSNTEVALDYDITLIAEFSLYNQKTNGYFFEGRKIEEKANVFVNNLYAVPGALDTQSLTQAEYQGLPQIARDLASKIASEAFGSW